MKKFLYLIIFALVAIMPASLTSCSESEDADTEYSDWQSRNDTYFLNIYNKAKQAIASGDETWRIERAYTKSDTATAITNFIVAKQLNDGKDYTKPLFTDSVKVHYRGYIMPSSSHNTVVEAYGSDMAVGYQFDSSWTGDYNLNTMKPSAGVVSGYITGFSTALQNMCTGERWLVFIPYNLGYGATAKTGIPAYSTLIFDITLTKSWKKRIEI